MIKETQCLGLGSEIPEVTELKVCPDVMHAMNEAHKQRRARDTAELTMASHAAQKAQEAGRLKSLRLHLYGKYDV